MTSNLITRSCLLAFDTGNLLFLLLCCYLLISKYNSGRRKNPQQLFLINLATSSILTNLFLMIRDAINVARFDRQSNHNITTREYIIQEYYNVHSLHGSFWCLNMGYTTGISYIYILARFYLTGDRLLHISLHMRYAQYWNIRKTWKLMIVTWLVGLSISIGLALYMYSDYVYVRLEAKISRMFAIYVLSSIYFVFAVFVVIAYYRMFILYARSKRRSRRRGSREPPTSLITFFVKSRFSVSLALVFSYLVLTVIPSLTRSMYYITGGSPPYPLTFFYLVATRASYTVDGLVYTLLQKENRTLLRKIIKRGRGDKHSNGQHSLISRSSVKTETTEV